MMKLLRFRVIIEGVYRLFMSVCSQFRHHVMRVMKLLPEVIINTKLAAVEETFRGGQIKVTEGQSLSSASRDPDRYPHIRHLVEAVLPKLLKRAHVGN